MSVLVLGIGNLVMSDDGIGVRVVQQLAGRYHFPDRVEVFDGGTQGLSLLPQLEGVERLIVVDAVETGGPPGTLLRLEGGDIPLALETKLSPHQMGLKDLLTVASLMGYAPTETVLWGVQPENIGMGMELSSPVEARLNDLTEKILEQLRRWGISVCLR